MKHPQTYSYKKRLRVRFRNKLHGSLRLLSLEYIAYGRANRLFNLARDRRNAKLNAFWESVPHEVSEAWMIRAQPLVGLESVNRAKQIVKKYPEWFPWEAKYDQIPKEVHTAYNNEVNESIWGSFEDNSVGDSQSGNKGLLWEIENAPVHYYNPEAITKETMLNWFVNAQKQEDERREAEEAQRELDKAIWDKHYAIYKLRYRE
jgi:hypothetical protein